MAQRRPRGELEAAVLRVLWEAGGPCTAREVQHRFIDADRMPAFTTVLTVLERLRAKGRVVRTEANGGGSLFAAAESESLSAANAMLSALVGSSDRSAALLRFAGELDPRDVEVLRAALDSERRHRAAP